MIRPKKRPSVQKIEEESSDDLECREDDESNESRQEDEVEAA